MNQSQKTSSRIRCLLAKEVTTAESPDLTQLLILHDQRKQKKSVQREGSGRRTGGVQRPPQKPWKTLKLQELDHEPQDQRRSPGEIQRGAGPERTELWELRGDRMWWWRRPLCSPSSTCIPPSKPPPSPATHPLFSCPPSRGWHLLQSTRLSEEPRRNTPSLKKNKTKKHA